MAGEMAQMIASGFASGEPAGGDAPKALKAALTLHQELEALARSAPAAPTDIREVIGKALETVWPLVTAKGVAVEYPTGGPRLLLNLQAAVLRQALISVLSAVVSHVSDGRLSIEVQAGPEQLAVTVRSQTRGVPVGELEDEGLQIAGELLRLSRGALQITPAGEQEVFAACLTLPVGRPAVVLAVDDNADTLQLFHRYLTGSRYQFVGAQNARQALALAEATLPDVIVLDVMMTEEDGWMLLGQFREDPRFRGIPVIICTVVPQEQLALLLRGGAVPA